MYGKRGSFEGRGRKYERERPRVWKRDEEFVKGRVWERDEEFV